MPFSKAFGFVCILWACYGLQCLSMQFFNIDLALYGLKPRSLQGSIGIITAPFLHGFLLHLITNSIGMIIMLSMFFATFRDRKVFSVIFQITIYSGLLVWMMGRDTSIHVGSSGLVYGLIGYATIASFRYRIWNLFIPTLIILYLGGWSLVEGMFTIGTNVSWEFHLMGAIAGIMIALFETKETISSEIGGSDDASGSYCVQGTRPPQNSGMVAKKVGA